VIFLGIQICSSTKSMPSRSKKAPLRSTPPHAPLTKHRKRASTSRLGQNYAAGRQTRGAIVRAAAVVLTRDGYARFSVQRVAAEAGISPGNLNYYFPTKASLLETLVTYTFAQYRDRAHKAGQQVESETRDSLGDVLLRLMQDARSDQTNRLFRELWAIALHDPQIAKAMDSFYTRSASAFLRRARYQSRAGFGEEQLEAVIYLMLVISEGVSVIFGTRPTADPLFNRVRNAAHQALMHLLLQTSEVQRL
jgi:AcrR family transcriptional regulator